MWDKAEPNSQPRRHLDTSKAIAEFEFRARTKSRDGLAATSRWYSTIQVKGLSARGICFVPLHERTPESNRVRGEPFNGQGNPLSQPDPRSPSK